MIKKLEPIYRFPGYFISSCGHVFSFKRKNPIQIKKAKDKDGYLVVYLYHGNKTYKRRVHVLVAEAFLNRPNGNNFEVDHLDNDRANPHFKNLEWVTRQENMKRLKCRASAKVKGEINGV